MIKLVRRALRRWKSLAAAAALAAVIVLWLRPTAPEPALLVTLAAAGDSPEQCSGLAIARLELGAPDTSPRVIVRGFAAVGVANVSGDGRRAIFAGRRAASDPMEIWEVSVSGSSPRAIVRGADCLDPCYLPDGRIVFARSVAATDARVWSLHTAPPGGGQQSRITFGAAQDRSPAVLPDGRIVFRRHSLRQPGIGRLFEMNTDGTGLELFCEPADGASMVAGPWSIGERVIFVEAACNPDDSDGGDELASGSRIVAVSADQPLAGREILAGGMQLKQPGDETFSSVCLLPDGGLAVSSFTPSHGWRLRKLEQRSARYAESLVAAVAIPDWDTPLSPIGAVLAAPRPKVLALTSVVDQQRSTGTLLCLDVHNSRIPALRGLQRGQVSAVRVLATDGTVVGEAPVHADGSFMIEVPANQPLELELHTADGALARDGSGFWVRPNENRGCVGCHEDPELSPGNAVPLALQASSR